MRTITILNAKERFISNIPIGPFGFAAIRLDLLFMRHRRVFWTPNVTIPSSQRACHFEGQLGIFVEPPSSKQADFATGIACFESASNKQANFQANRPF
jgi:hypothetical protein